MNTLAILPLGVFGPWQIVVIVFVILLLFGGRKIPELMRGLGKGVKEFRKGMDEVEKELDSQKPEKDEKSEKNTGK